MGGWVDGWLGGWVVDEGLKNWRMVDWLSDE